MLLCHDSDSSGSLPHHCLLPASHTSQHLCGCVPGGHTWRSIYVPKHMNGFKLPRELESYKPKHMIPFPHG